MGEGRWAGNGECCGVPGLASRPVGHGGELPGEVHHRAQSSETGSAALAAPVHAVKGGL